MSNSPSTHIDWYSDYAVSAEAGRHCEPHGRDPLKSSHIGLFFSIYHIVNAASPQMYEAAPLSQEITDPTGLDWLTRDRIVCYVP